MRKPKKKPADKVVKMKNGPNMKAGPKPEAKKPPKPLFGKKGKKPS